LAAPVTPPALDDIQGVKVTKDMLGLAKHIVSQKAGHFEADKIEDQYETMVPLS
jgi:DNA end-binding protein Ku